VVRGRATAGVGEAEEGAEEVELPLGGSDVGADTEEVRDAECGAAVQRLAEFL
jgi:hypothetical protein